MLGREYIFSRIIAVVLANPCLTTSTNRRRRNHTQMTSSHQDRKEKGDLRNSSKLAHYFVREKGGTFGGHEI